MKWRKVIRILHRDIGYAATALTIIFSISGVAVNHVDDWDPTYVITTDSVKITPIFDSVLTFEQEKAHIITELNITESIKNYSKISSDEINILLEMKTFSVNIRTGSVFIENYKGRKVFRKMNFLHLNTPKKLWTWVSDIFAVALILLAFTGLLILKGKKGFSGRGKWFFAVGMLIPILFLLLYF